MKVIKREKAIEVTSKAIKAYFEGKTLDIRLEVDKEFKEWVQQKEAREDFSSAMEETINKIHNEGGLLNEIVINRDFKFEEIDDERSMMIIDFDYN